MMTIENCERFLNKYHSQWLNNIYISAIESAEAVQAATPSTAIKDMDTFEYLETFGRYKVKKKETILDKECTIVFDIANIRREFNENYGNMALFYMLYMLDKNNFDFPYNVIFRFENEKDMEFSKEILGIAQLEFYPKCQIIDFKTELLN